MYAMSDTRDGSANLLITEKRRFSLNLLFFDEILCCSIEGFRWDYDLGFPDNQMRATPVSLAALTTASATAGATLLSRAPMMMFSSFSSSSGMREASA